MYSLCTCILSSIYLYLNNSRCVCLWIDKYRKSLTKISELAASLKSGCRLGCLQLSVLFCPRVVIIKVHLYSTLRSDTRTSGVPWADTFSVQNSLQDVWNIMLLHQAAVCIFPGTIPASRAAAFSLMTVGMLYKCVLFSSAYLVLYPCGCAAAKIHQVSDVYSTDPSNTGSFVFRNHDSKKSHKFIIL